MACKIINIEPKESNCITQDTKILIHKENKIDSVNKNKDYNKNNIKISSFDEIIGQEYAKRKCYIIEKYLLNPSKFGKWAPKNILFYGPSGTGKTMMAKALANKVNVPFFSIKATKLIGEFVGEGSKQIHDLYDKAESVAPCIIFIDEIDAIALDRKYQDLRGDVVEIVNSLITEMDGLSDRKGICTIGSTNRLDSLDISVRSRFENEIEFVLPSEKEIKKLILYNVKSFPLPLNEDFDIDYLVSSCYGLSNRDIVEKVLKTALHDAIIENNNTVTFDSFKKATTNIKKTSQFCDLNRLYS